MAMSIDQLCIERDGVVVSLNNDTVIAQRDVRNPLTPGAAAGLAQADRTIIAWSGTLADDLFDTHPMNWMRPGHDAFAAFTSDLAQDVATTAGRVLLQPHSRHVLSDTQTSYNFVRSDLAQASGLGLALCPATLLEPSMFDPVEDHLIRIFETLAPEAAMIFLTDAAIAVDTDSVVPMPLGAGRLPLGLVRTLAEHHIRPGLPIVLIDDDLPSQLRYLGLGG